MTIIKDVIAIAILVTIAVSCGTSNRINTNKVNTNNLPDSVVVDTDGNRYPVKQLSDGNLWMTTNLNLNIANTYCCDSTSANCQQYGRLYTWESANQGCVLLGEKWRLPTISEWTQLSRSYGAAAEDSGALPAA